MIFLLNNRSTDLMARFFLLLMSMTQNNPFLPSEYGKCLRKMRKKRIELEAYSGYIISKNVFIVLLFSIT